jgi:Zn-dependent peptidase ImmA (M78 family)
VIKNSKTFNLWERHANEVLSHFIFNYPFQIDIYEICRRYQIKVIERDDLDECDAFSIPLLHGQKGLIYVRKEMDKRQKRILLAEEFCHIYCHCLNQLHIDDISLIDKSEYQAKKMAAFLLIPDELIKGFDVQHYGINFVYELADEFNVTYEFMKCRLEIGGLFNQYIVNMAAN